MSLSLDTPVRSTRSSSMESTSRDALLARIARFSRSETMYLGSIMLLTITPVTSFMLPASWHILGPHVPIQMGILLPPELSLGSQSLGGVHRNCASAVRLNRLPVKSTFRR